VIWLAVPPVAAAVIGGVVWWLRRRYLVVTVLGRSMLPTYADGDRVLVRRRRSGRGVRVGDVAVADLPVWLYRVGAGPPGTAREPDPAARPTSAWSVLPQSERVVKRVAAGPGDPVPPGVVASGEQVPADQVVLLGDNPAESADSRRYGCVPLRQVIGVARRRLR
jgi:signal peptidase I